jgi:Xaa-Pro aminopeptidase
MICPALSESQARRAGVADVRSWRDGEDPLVHFSQLADDWDLRSGILAVDDEMPAQMLLKMQSVLPAALFRAGQPAIATLMQRKEPQELQLLRDAAAIADQTFERVLGFLRPGLTERQVSRFLADTMAELGGQPTFAITATGPASAEPHHESDDTAIEDGQVLLMDFGCDLQGYKSDITRTVNIGKATDEAKRVYDVVYRAHMAGRAAIVPGATGDAIDQAARRVIEEAGYGEYFVHRTGHGIGLRGHEEPYIIGGNHEPLEPGNCFSVEPGVYIPGNLGVRVENIVTATETGHESLNAEPAAQLLEVFGG